MSSSGGHFGFAIHILNNNTKFWNKQYILLCQLILQWRKYKLDASRIHTYKQVHVHTNKKIYKILMWYFYFASCYIVAVSFIGRGNRMLCQVHLAWAGFELTTLVVKITECIGSRKSNFHMITATTAMHSLHVWALYCG